MTDTKLPVGARDEGGDLLDATAEVVEINSRQRQTEAAKAHPATTSDEPSSPPLPDGGLPDAKPASAPKAALWRRWSWALRLAAGLAACAAALLVFAGVYVEAWRGPALPALVRDVQSAAGSMPSLLSQPTTPAPAAAKPAVIFVNSQPSGAFVSLNGMEQGQTPVAANVDCTKALLLIEVTLDGYRPWRKTATCEPGRDHLFDAALVRAGTPRHSHD
jgi:hypothetical protein